MFCVVPQLGIDFPFAEDYTLRGVVVNRADGVAKSMAAGL